jgi:hypothetical protein
MERSTLEVHGHSVGKQIHQMLKKSNAHLMNVAVFWVIAPRSSCVCVRSRLLHIGVFLGCFFDPEDGGDTFFRNVGPHTNYTEREGEESWGW